MEGTVIFVQHDRHAVSIEYLSNGRKKKVNGSVSTEEDEAMPMDKNRSPHTFREGDKVSFDLEASTRGDKMIAKNIRFLFNNAFSQILHDASNLNDFSGYLKLVDDQFFVKELGSYLFFPLRFSPWEQLPGPQDLNEPIRFQLENFKNPDKVKAVLRYRKFIPEYIQAAEYLKKDKPVDAIVTKVSPHGVHASFFGGKISVRLSLPSEDAKIDLSPGAKIKIQLTHVGPDKLAARLVQV